MKTILTEVTLIDLLTVCMGLPEDEIEQIEAFTGDKFDPEKVAVDIYVSGGMKWTCRVEETSEPLVVAGYSQVGASIWRSFMLANEHAWAEFGGEVTHHVIEVMERVAQGKEHIRLETICLATRKLAQRWYKRIGLERESEMQSYGVNGEDAVMYVKINKPAKEDGVICVVEQIPQRQQLKLAKPAA